MIFRSDNRAPDQIRPVNIIPDFISTAEGSALIEMGNTRVICTASVEETVPAFLRNSGKGWISGDGGAVESADTGSDQVGGRFQAGLEERQECADLGGPPAAPAAEDPGPLASVSGYVPSSHEAR